MQVKVSRLPRPNVEESVEVREGARVLDVLRAASIPPDAVIVLADGGPLALDAEIAAGARLRIVNVFSGG